MRIKVRGVIRKNNSIFLSKLVKQNFFCLPGGTYDREESLKSCLEREFIEELNIKPVIGNPILVREFQNSEGFTLDIWFEILNVDDFENIDKTGATHGFENCEERFYTFEEISKLDVKPDDILDILKSGKCFDLIG